MSSLRSILLVFAAMLAPHVQAEAAARPSPTPPPSASDSEEITLDDAPTSIPAAAAKPSTNVDNRKPAAVDETEVVDDGNEKIYQIHHPNAAKGLIRINGDNSYQYQVKIKESKTSASFGLFMMTPPNVTNVYNGTTISYNQVYGEQSIVGPQASFEWIPFRKFGYFGAFFEFGLGTVHGNGILASNPPQEAEETYTLFVIPLTVMLKYRFQYSKKQYVVPYIEGGASYYGLVEMRSDNQQTNIAGTEVAGGGGGLAISLTRGNVLSMFGLSREYGISEMWLNLEGRAMAGLKPSLDFTNTTFNLGVTVDY